MADETRKDAAVAELAKGVTDSAFVLNPERKILEFNRPFIKLHKTDPRGLRNLKGSFCRDHVQMEICEKSCIVQQCLETGISVRFDEVKGTTRTGESLDLIVSAIPIRGRDGQIESVLEMHRDVTDEAKIHSKYKILLDKEKRAKEELERLVDERTAELRKTNEELKKAEASLVHSEKMSSIGQMVAGIAHELNNPINFICGNVEIIEEYQADLRKALAALEELFVGQDQLKDQFAKLEEEWEMNYKIDDLGSIASSLRTGSERAAEIIQGLRTFSRLDEAELKETDIHQDIDTTLMLLRNKYKNHVEIHKEYGDIPAVRCYSSQLNQVYMNLLHNAIQAIDKKGDIWIRTRLESENVTIEFVDNGKGMDEETKKKIFDPFFTTKAVGEGTGLGLSISYGIVERHGGVIEVESAEGKGTTFRLQVPLKQQTVGA